MSTVLAPVEQMVTVVYVSSATRPFEDCELAELLREARRNNEQLGITGMLLYRDGNFLQVLEGPASDVEQLIAKIRRDPRHRDFILMARQNVEERQFSEWNMAFRNMNKDCSVEDGYHPFLEPAFDDDEMGEDNQLVFKLLRRFKETMR